MCNIGQINQQPVIGVGIQRTYRTREMNLPPVKTVCLSKGNQSISATHVNFKIQKQIKKWRFRRNGLQRSNIKRIISLFPADTMNRIALAKIPLVEELIKINSGFCFQVGFKFSSRGSAVFIRWKYNLLTHRKKCCRYRFRAGSYG